MNEKLIENENLILHVYQEKFEFFKKLLIEYNKKYNLTSILDENEIFYKHFLDSSAGNFLFEKNANVLEVGSGAGFPSLVLKILRDDLQFTLVESTGKKCEFLQAIVDNLQLKNVKICNERAEVLAKDNKFREKYQIVTARAVARMNTLSEYCLPFVKVGGKFIAYKGECAEEIKEAEKAILILGGKMNQIISYDLPNDYGKRSLIEIKKIKSTPIQYPRGNGKERKKPLL